MSGVFAYGRSARTTAVRIACLLPGHFYVYVQYERTPLCFQPRRCRLCTDNPLAGTGDETREEVAVLSGVDHLVILVRQLDEAIAAYRQLGFHVTPGGAHPEGTHNALVPFADGAYLELIAFSGSEPPVRHRWARFARPGGLIDIALRTDDVEADIARLRRAGLAYRGPMPGARRLPDGTEIAWRMGWAPDDRTGELPFLIDDVTARELRVPAGQAATHPNGVTGLQAVTVAVRDLDESAREFAILLGQEPSAAVTDEELSATTRTFVVGPHRIVLACPTLPGSPLVSRIQQQGDGPFAATLLAGGAEEAHAIPAESAEGARLVIVHDG